MSVFLGTNQVGSIDLIQRQIINTNLEDELIYHTILSYNNSEILNIKDYAFAYCSNLTSVNFPKCSYIGNDAFYSCSSLSNISFPNCSYIGDYAFAECDNLTSADFPNCTSMGDFVFYYCYSLTIVNFPNCSVIGSNAFYECASLTSISFPKCISIGSSAFRRCSNLISVDFPNCTSIGDYAFANCSNLTLVDFPSCISIGDYAFYSCGGLSSISFPNCSYIGASAFGYCFSLTSINLSNCTSIGSRAFAYCSNLTSISFPSCSYIGYSAFYSCYNLLSLYLMGSSIPRLVGTNAFTSTPISNYTTSTGGVYGSIYVPASLYSSYITTTNWSVYSARIVGVNIMTITYINDEYSSDYFYEPSMTWTDWVNSDYNTDGFYIYNPYAVCVDSADTGDRADLEDSVGEEISPNDRISECTDVPFHMPARLSKSGIIIMDNSEDNIKHFIYEIDMTWAEWIDSDYNTTNLVVDNTTSYVGIWNDTNNTYVYLTSLHDSTYNVLSTHKIVEDVDNYPTNDFQIDAVLTA